MIRHLTRPFLVGVGLAAVVSVAVAGVPDPITSSNDGPIMVGNARGYAILPAPFLVPTICDGYKLIIRDVGTTPLAGVTVMMFFTGTGIKVHATQSGGQVANCVNNTLAAVTNPAGEVIFFPATVGQNTSTAPNVLIRASGILMTTIRLPSIDLLPTVAGLSAVDIADLNQFRLRFLNTPPHSNRDPECDYATLGTSAGIVDLADFNVFRTEFLCGMPLPGVAPAPCGQTECP